MWRLESVQLAEASRRVPAGPLVREASAATRPFPKKRLEVVRPSDGRAERILARRSLPGPCGCLQLAAKAVVGPPAAGVHMGVLLPST